MFPLLAPPNQNNQNLLNDLISYAKRHLSNTEYEYMSDEHFKISEELALKVSESWGKASNIRDAMKLAGVKSQSQRRWYRIRRAAEKKLGVTLAAHNQAQSPESLDNSCPSYLDVKSIKKSTSFVVTCAVNNSALNEKFFDALELFSEAKEASLVVIPQKYRHNLFMSQKDYVWPERIYDYALTSDFIVNKNLVISPTPIISTAVNPLTGLDSCSGQRSAIYGATQVALNSIATPGDDDPKIITTTGACTARVYTDTKAGRKAKFNHSFSAIYVKVDGQKFNLIHLHWDGKGFYYLDEYWSKDGVDFCDSSAALVQGDSHAVYSQDWVLETRDRFVSKVNPENLVWHDLHDHKYQSHHNNAFDLIRLARSNQFLVEEELKISEELVNTYGKGRKNLIVGSNHNDALDKWLIRFDPNKDPHNAVFAWDLSSQVIKSGKDAFQAWLSPRLKVPYKFLDRNKAHKIKGIDVSQHGDIGANGSRGSVNGFANLSNKTITGHGHSGFINKGHYRVGVSTKAMPYAQNGYSSWSICDCLIYNNGKRALIFYFDGKTIADI